MYLHEPRKKKTLTFHSTGCLIGILIMVYYNPHITGEYNPLYTLNNRFFSTAHMNSCEGFSLHS